jgi:hypothetical protein
MKILAIALLLASAMPAAETMNAQKATRMSAEAKARIIKKAISEVAKREQQAWYKVIGMIAASIEAGTNKADAVVDDDLVENFKSKLVGRGFTVAVYPEAGFGETVLHISWPEEAP